MSNLQHFARVFVVCAGLGLTPNAHAQAQEPREDPEFATEFSSGLRAEDEGAFERARAHYERALARAETLAQPAPRLRSLLALGWVQYNLREHVRSVEYLKRAVADPDLPAQRRREAQALIDEQLKSLGQLRIDIRPPPGASAQIGVTVDGRNVTDPRDVPVAPGEHEVRANATGFRELALQVNVAAGESRPVTAVLQREDEGTPPMRQAAWIAGGAAALSLAIGIGAGAYSWAKHGESECVSDVTCTAEHVDDRNAAIVAGNVSTVAWIVAGVSGAASAYLFWQSGSSSEMRVDVGLTGLHLTQAF